MILQLGADAPLILRAAAVAALVLHVSGGAMGIASGWTAILAAKGQRLHRVAGTVFFVAMLTMAGVAAIVAPLLPDSPLTNTTAAVFTFYLVATAWAAVRRPAGEVGRFERIAVAAPIGIVVMAAGLTVINDPRGGDGTVYMFAVLSVLAAVCDLRMIRAGGIAGAPRVARHLWRMTAALAVATGSFFVGQPRFVPEVLKDTGLNVAPLVGVLVLLAFWMIRIRFPHALRLRRAAAA